MKGPASGFRKTISTLYSLSFLSPVKVEINTLVNFSHLFKEAPKLVLGDVAFPRPPPLKIHAVGHSGFAVERGL